MPDPPPTLSYRSPQTRVGRAGLGVDYADVAVGFLSLFVALPLVAGAVLAGVRGDLLSGGVAVAAMAIIGAGFVRGVSRGRWGFLAGAGLFAGVLGGFAALVLWLARP